MINFKQYLEEMSLRRPEGLKDLLGDPYVRISDFHDEENSITVKRLTEFAMKHGWKKLGQGHFGAAFGHDKYQWCIKIFSDMAYLNWINYCQTTTSRNSFLPRFKGKVYHLRTKGHWSGGIIRLEKLRPISKQKWLDTLKQIENARANQMRNDPDLVEIARLIDKVMKTKQFGGERAYIDLHQGNMMCRENGDVVLIDPIAGAEFDSYYGYE